LRFEGADALPPARIATRMLDRDWWVYSFSQLAREDSGADARGAEDEAEPPPLQRQRFAGTRFGNALHQALEHVDFARWTDADGEHAPEGELEILKQALRGQDYAESDLGDGAHELALLVARTLNAPLGVRATHDMRRDVRLCDVPAATRIAELEFHFTLVDADTQALLALLHAGQVVPDRTGFGSAHLTGLMNGKIDLTCCIDGRLHVLDYKSNRLPDYAPDTLRQAMRASEYDLQALLYVTALHRWLRLRRGGTYDYGRYIGGVRYLFCRGLDPARPGQGIVSMEFERELIEAVDTLFAPDGGRA